jgi:transcription elongation factor GreA
MEQGKEYLTKNKHEELTVELGHLKTFRRKEVAENLERAKSLGDLSENAEYQEAREDQAKTESRIGQLENILKTAIIVSHKKGDTAEVGSVVVVKKEKDTEKKTYEIVGSEEADMSAGKISYLSPLGSAMIGKKKEDTFSFDTPNGKVDYKVVSVE